MGAWVVAIVGMVSLIALESLNISGFKSTRISKFLLPMTIIVLGFSL